MLGMIRNLILIAAMLVLPLALSACATTAQPEPAKPCEACLKHADIKCECKTCKRVKGINQCKDCQCTTHDEKAHQAPAAPKAEEKGTEKKKCHCPEKK